MRGRRGAPTSAEPPRASRTPTRSAPPNDRSSRTSAPARESPPPRERPVVPRVPRGAILGERGRRARVTSRRFHASKYRRTFDANRSNLSPASPPGLGLGGSDTSNGRRHPHSAAPPVPLAVAVVVVAAVPPRLAERDARRVRRRDNLGASPALPGDTGRRPSRGRFRRRPPRSTTTQPFRGRRSSYPPRRRPPTIVRTRGLTSTTTTTTTTTMTTATKRGRIDALDVRREVTPHQFQRVGGA